MQTEEKDYYENKRVIEKEDRYKYLNHQNKNIIIIIILIIIFLTGLIIFIKSFRKIDITSSYSVTETLEVECPNTIMVNQEVPINIIIKSDIINSNINYLSSDSSIVEVSKSGVIKGITKGTANIFIVYFDINNDIFTKTINIKVE